MTRAGVAVACCEISRDGSINIVAGKPGKINTAEIDDVTPIDRSD